MIDNRLSHFLHDVFIIKHRQFDHQKCGPASTIPRQISFVSFLILKNSIRVLWQPDSIAIKSSQIGFVRRGRVFVSVSLLDMALLLARRTRFHSAAHLPIVTPTG